MSWRRLSFQEDVLKALSNSFPALEHIDGFEMDGLRHAPGLDFVEFMRSDVERLAECLPKLKTLVMHRFYRACPIDTSQIKDLDCFDSFAEPAFASLHRLFPSITRATFIEHVVANYRPHLLMISYFFNAEGVVDRQIRLHGDDWGRTAFDDMV
ncbi:hypothetical protein SISNIDRAFT_489261 [Sistotremastrum niveocremeum HHB9708]|uniref:Uncharacterized protein n=1 Tax=Sistotremastrum niveocremeum HHB9708 TaxID=1314777 RepID=A0A164Q3A4_9AGAM|nr:hypothetical protein SISNIDRAFT_489261 [Sistotremastrum niveocremeum HHB9708]